jgi:uncharacterized membrane protein
MMILWFIIIGVVVYLLIGGNFDFNSFQKRSVEDKLDERLAKGEINVKEYQELKTTLKEDK